MHWTQRQSPVFPEFYFEYPRLTGIAYGNGQFVAVGSVDETIYSRIGNPLPVILSSSDGLFWDQVPTRLSAPTRLGDIAFGNGQFVAVGQTSAFGVGDIIQSRAILTSSDGYIWSERDSGPDPLPLNLMNVAYGNGQFMATSAGVVLTSSDGANWIQHSWPVPNPGGKSIAFGDGRFVALGLNDAMTGSIWHSGPIVTLSAIPQRTPGVFAFSANGLAGRSYAIEGSADLISWQSVTNFTTALVPGTVSVPQSASAGHSFYRVTSH
jgi:hypothetical protein